MILINVFTKGYLKTESLFGEKQYKMSGNGELRINVDGTPSVYTRYDLFLEFSKEEAQKYGLGHNEFHIHEYRVTPEYVLSVLHPQNRDELFRVIRKKYEERPRYFSLLQNILNNVKEIEARVYQYSVYIDNVFNDLGINMINVHKEITDTAVEISTYLLFSCVPKPIEMKTTVKRKEDLFDEVKRAIEMAYKVKKSKERAMELLEHICGIFPFSLSSRNLDKKLKEGLPMKIRIEEPAYSGVYNNSRRYVFAVLSL